MPRRRQRLRKSLIFIGVFAPDTTTPATGAGVVQIQMWPTEARTGGAGGADGYPARAFLRPVTML